MSNRQWFRIQLGRIGPNGRRRLLWGASLFAGYSLLGLLKFAYCYLDGAAHDEATLALEPFVEEMAGAYGGMLLLPLVVWAARRFEPKTGRRLEAGIGHLGACLARSFAHTSWNGLSRMALFPMLGLGEYDYGAWSVRFWMELPNDIVSYGYTLAAVSLYLHLRKPRPSESTPGPRAKHLLVRGRDSATLLALDEIDWVSAARNYVEIHSAGRSYLMRGTLSGLEETLDPGRFLRVNRSQLVRVGFIRELKLWDRSEYRMVLRDGTTLVWSRRYRRRGGELVLESL